MLCLCCLVVRPYAESICVTDRDLHTRMCSDISRAVNCGSTLGKCDEYMISPALKHITNMQHHTNWFVFLFFSSVFYLLLDTYFEWINEKENKSTLRDDRVRICLYRKIEIIESSFWQHFFFFAIYVRTKRAAFDWSMEYMTFLPLCRSH